MSKAKIVYGDYAVGAKESFNPTATGSKYSEYLENLKSDNIKLKNYCNPCESYQMLLDGSAVAYPDDIETADIGLMSSVLSEEDGTFATPPVLTLTSSSKFTSDGISLIFDTFNDIYATKVGIQWFQNSTDLHGEVIFNPTTSNYFCSKKTENYNKLVITFYSINMPNNRLRLFKLDYGKTVTFSASNLRNVSVVQSINPISTEIKISSLDFTLDIAEDYTFQSKQPMILYNDTELIGTFFVQSSNRQSKQMYQITAEDYISILDKTGFIGGVYDNVSATKLLQQIFTVANVPYVIESNLDNIKLSGYIPYTTCREALLQVCFASCAMVTTANKNYIEIVTGTTQFVDVSEDRIMQGQNFTNDDVVTAINVTAYKYSPISKMEDDLLYDAAESGTGDNILIQFSEPKHSLYLKKSVGEIIESGTNYAIINATVDSDGNYTKLYGSPYNVTQQIYTKNNEIITAGTLSNVKQITDATLVSNDNVNSVLENCYNYYINKTQTINCTIIDTAVPTKTFVKTLYGSGKYGQSKYGFEIKEDTGINYSIQPGSIVNVATEYLGILSGTVEEISFDLNSGIVVKEVTLK